MLIYQEWRAKKHSCYILNNYAISVGGTTSGSGKWADSDTGQGCIHSERLFLQWGGSWISRWQMWPGSPFTSSKSAGMPAATVLGKEGPYHHYTWFDHCNSTTFGGKSMGSQLTQNAAPCMVTVASRFKHITSILTELHWFPIAFHVQIKLLIFTYSK